MRRIILLLAVMLCLPFMANAQERSYRDVYASLDTMSAEDRAGTEQKLKELEIEFQKDQVKSIAGIPFGISKEKALSMLKNKFGEPRTVTNSYIAFENIKYARYEFDAVVFEFQSDGANTFFNACTFGKYASSFSKALDLESEYAQTLSEKYKMVTRFADENGNPMHLCGYSPLWNGTLRDFDSNSHIAAIHTSILPNETSYKDDDKYMVRLIYGPYNYVKEEF